MAMAVGMEKTLTVTVDREKTAAAVGSGMVEVYATPMMVALMEAAAVGAIQEHLLPEETSVGTALTITHSSATPVGMKVSASATVTRIEGREVEFSVSAWDEAGEIGQGTHTRFVVDRDRFLQRAMKKLPAGV